MTGICFAEAVEDLARTSTSKDFRIVPLPILYSWLPPDAVHLESVPLEYKIPKGETGKATLQGRVERIFSDPVKVNSGDCMVVIFGRRGNGATDNETQVNALMGP